MAKPNQIEPGEIHNLKLRSVQATSVTPGYCYSPAKCYATLNRCKEIDCPTHEIVLRTVGFRDWASYGRPVS